jgi:hypothetical protein
MDVVEATRSYEHWLRAKADVVEADLRLKHVRMSQHSFVFLRGTFYRWLQRWPLACRHLTGAPRVFAVGDLHVENFGTWRDAEGRLVWGVNDVDEACRLPYTQDLVRLATSAVLAVGAGHFAISAGQACDAILTGYRMSIAQGGAPIVLAERRRWLREIALNELRDPRMFWETLSRLRATRGAAPARLLRASLPERGLPCRLVRRVAGVGSLGRPRFVAIATWNGALIAREAKALVPSAAEWLGGAVNQRVSGADLLRRAVRSPDPCFFIRAGWIVRRLAPDCARIEIGDLPAARDERRLLERMGWETGNLHLASARETILRDLKARPRRWLRRAAAAMADVVTEDWRRWRRAQPYRAP